MVCRFRTGRHGRFNPPPDQGQAVDSGDIGCKCSEEQRVNFVNSIRAHPGHAAKYEDNADPYNRGLALEKLLQDVMLKERKDELELYKLFASDPAFKAAWSQNIEQVLKKDLDTQSPS